MFRLRLWLRCWLVWRYLKSEKTLFNLTSTLSILGLSIGVAALVVAMSIISGFKSTLKQSVIDVFGDVVVVKSMKSTKAIQRSEREIKQLIEEINADKEVLSDLPSGKIKLLSMTPYATVEGLVVHQKKVSGIVLQGLDPSNYTGVLNLDSRVVQGEIDLSTQGQITGVAIGQTMADKFQLSLGNTFKVVVPIIQGYGNFKAKVKVLRVTGILTFGRYEYDLRNILIDLKELQSFVGFKSRISGLRLNIENSDNALILSQLIISKLSDKDYWAMNWRQVNRTLFDAVDYEQVIIFLILMIIVVAASFNVASTLFVSVLKRFRDISTLRALGMTRSVVRSLFVIHGLIIGVMGYLLGLFWGWLAGMAFMYSYKKYSLLSGEVYRLDGLELSIRFMDLFLIFVVCLGVCYLSTIGPSLRSGNLSLVDGFKYE